MDQNNPNNDEINVIELFGVLRENFFNLIVVILFFAILTGLNFRNQQQVLRSSASQTDSLSDDDRKFVLNAIDDAALSLNQ